MDRDGIADRLLSLLFPKRCVLCGRVVEYETLWCGKCPCLSPADEEAHSLAPFAYEGGVRDAILRLKREPDNRTARFFALRMAELVRPELECPADWYAVPVPIHPAGLKERGFNQAELLAKALSERLGTGMLTNLLVRLDSSVRQRELDREARLRHAMETYRPKQGAVLPEGISVLLVDDVFTTGATATACASHLTQLGAVRVLTVTAAKTALRHH